MISSTFAGLASLSAVTANLAKILPPVVSRNPRCYPFVGQKAVKAMLESNDEFRMLTFVALFHLQTEHEQEAQDTKDRNRRGFMSSHAWHGSRIAKALLLGESVSLEDEAKIDEIAVRYSGQITALLRSHAMAVEPELAVTARMFSVNG